MKFLLIYFTGTYNTRYLTDELELRLENHGHTVDRVEINCEAEVKDTSGYDFIGFSYPIYGFNPPRPFYKYFNKLKFTPGQKYFIYKNSGETLAMNNASSRVIIRKMASQKAVFSGEYHFVMPYNIHFPYDKTFVREILDKDFKLLDILVHDLENGVVKKIESKAIYNLGAFFVAIQQISGDVNSFLYKVDKEKCVSCMKCVNTCPEKNIKVVDGKIKFGHHCDMCMRCSFYCPTDAIHIGFLKNWKVNGDYKLKKLAEDKTPYEPYITENSEGFYKCFIKTFADIDAEYDRILPSSNEAAYEAEAAITCETGDLSQNKEAKS